MSERKPRFVKTFCSQCGGEFGPGDSGFSHCSDHWSPAVTKAMAKFEAGLIARRVREDLDHKTLVELILETRREPGIWRATVQAKVLADKIVAALAKADDGMLKVTEAHRIDDEAAP